MSYLSFRPLCLGLLLCITLSSCIRFEDEEIPGYQIVRQDDLNAGLSRLSDDPDRPIDYYFPSDLIITDSLFIEPGTVIIVNEDKSIFVEGVLHIEGTADAPVHLSSSGGDAYWHSLQVESDAKLYLRHTKLYNNTDVALAENSSVSIQYCTFKEEGSGNGYTTPGIIFFGDAILQDSLKYNEFLGNLNFPYHFRKFTPSSINAISLENKYGEWVLGVKLGDDSYFNPDETELPAGNNIMRYLGEGLDYYLMAPLIADRGLLIEPGVSLRGDEIETGYAVGGIDALGTPEKPVVFHNEISMRSEYNNFEHVLFHKTIYFRDIYGGGDFNYVSFSDVNAGSCAFEKGYNGTYLRSTFNNIDFGSRPPSKHYCN